MLGMTLATAAAAVAPGRADAQRALPEPTPRKLPVWRGFNLLSKFQVASQSRFDEQDFAWIAEWGMNFARLPMDYRCWADESDWTRLKEPILKEIDEAIALGRKHRVHVHLNFHRAPGYTVAQPAEAKDIWKDEEAQRVCAMHWGAFAKRYKGIPNTRLSFNLFNEPAMVAPEAHRKVVARMVEAIHSEDPSRLIVCDGRQWGNTAPMELVGLGVAAATRGYQPMPISHWHANWVGGSDRWPEPTYPLKEGAQVWDRAFHRERFIKPWVELQKQGVGVMVGEFGAFNRTPHSVVMGWMRDCLANWKDAGWGWALWNLRGSFGILDSGRTDVRYEDWQGHKLDRAMLDLLRAN
jgi:endoglucanase